MVIRNIARLVQLLSCFVAAAFLVLLFANEPKLLAAPKPPATTLPATASVTSGVTRPGSPTTAAVAGSVATTPPPTQAPVATTTPIDAAALFANRCASCHGAAGQGGVGPGLSAGRVATKFPDIEQQVALVRDGKGGMPTFGRRIGEDEIRAVVRYTRTL